MVFAGIYDLIVPTKAVYTNDKKIYFMVFSFFFYGCLNDYLNTLACCKCSG